MYQAIVCMYSERFRFFTKNKGKFAWKSNRKWFSLKKIVPVKGEWLERSHRGQGALGGQVFVRLAVGVGFREWEVRGNRGLSECFIHFLQQIFKDEGLHEGRQKRTKNKRLGDLQGCGLWGTGGPHGAHKLLSCGLIRSLSQLLKNKKKSSSNSHCW